MTGRSKKSAKRAAKSIPAKSTDSAIEAIFAAYPKPVRTKLLALRRLIFDTAKTTGGVGPLEEALKWGQPSYLTSKTRSGSTIRIDQVKSVANQYAVYFHCQTDLVATFRELYPREFRYGGNRCILFSTDDVIDKPALRHCLALALTYHLNRRKGLRHR